MSVRQAAARLGCLAALSLGAVGGLGCGTTGGDANAGGRVSAEAGRDASDDTASRADTRTSDSSGRVSEEAGLDAGSDAPWRADAGVTDSSRCATDSAPDPACSQPSWPPTLPKPELTCGAPASNVVSSKPTSSDTLQADASSSTASFNNHARTFALGSAVDIIMTAGTTKSDTLVYALYDDSGTKLVSGSLAVAAGTTQVTVSCTAKLAGYFSLQASLQTSGAVPPHLGTRPQDLVTFGILPDFTSVLPPLPYASLEDHRIGAQAYAALNGSDNFEPLNSDLGATWTQISQGLAALEPSAPNTFVPNLNPGPTTESKAGLAPYYVLNGIPVWENSSAAPNEDQYPPTNYTYYQNFMSRVGQQVHANQKLYPTMQHNYYQGTWEPDEWKGTAPDMVSMYEAIYKGVHASDPNAVVLGITSCCSAFWASELDTYGPGLWQWIDGLSIHGYISQDDDLVRIGQGPDETPFVTNLRNLRALMVAHLPAHAKLFSTEAGWGYPSAPSATYPDAQTLDLHLVYNVRNQAMLLGEGADVSFLFYGADFFSLNGFGLYFNLTTTEYGPPEISPKPAAMGLAALTRLLDHTITLGAVVGLPSDVTAYAFKDASGRAVTVLWAHNPTFTATATASLLVDASNKTGSVVVIDTMGNPKVAAYASGAVSLDLTEQPIYVISENATTVAAHVLTPAGYAP